MNRSAEEREPETVGQRLRRLDRAFGMAPKGPALRLSERRQLLAAVRTDRTGELDPELVLRARAWSRRMRGPKMLQAQRVLIAVWGVVVLFGVVLVFLDWRTGAVPLLAGCVNLPVQSLALRRARRDATEILDGLPPSPGRLA